MSERIKIGDREFTVNVVNFELTEQYKVGSSPTIRTFGDIVIPLSGKILNVSLSLEFTSIYSVNEELRPLYAMFLRMPILRIKSKWLKNILIDGIDEAFESVDTDVQSFKNILGNYEDVIWVVPLSFNASITGPRSINVQLNITPVDILGLNIEPKFLKKISDAEAQTIFMDKILSMKDKYSRELLKQKSSGNVVLNNDEDIEYFKKLIEDLKKDYNSTIGNLETVLDPALSEPFKLWYLYLLEEYREKYADMYPGVMYPVLSKWKPSDSFKSSIKLDYPVLTASEASIKEQVRGLLSKVIDDTSKFIESWNNATSKDAKSSLINTLGGIVNTLLDPNTYFVSQQGTFQGGVKVPITRFLGNNVVFTMLEKLKAVPTRDFGKVLDANDPIVKMDNNIYKGKAVFTHLSTIINDEIKKGNTKVVEGIVNAIVSTISELQLQYDFIYRNFDYNTLDISPTDAVPVSVTVAVDNKVKLQTLLGKNTSIPQFFGTSSPVLKVQVRTQSAAFIQRLKDFRLKYEAALDIQRRFNYFLNFLKDLRLDIKISSPDNIFGVFGIHNVVLTDLTFRPDPEQAQTTIIDMGFIQSDLGRNMYEVYNIHRTTFDETSRRFFAYIWASALHEFMEYGGCSKASLIPPLQLIELYKDYPIDYILGGNLLSGGDATSMGHIIEMLKAMKENGVDLWNELIKNDVMEPAYDTSKWYDTTIPDRYIHTWNMDINNDGTLVPVTINPVDFDYKLKLCKFPIPAQGSEFVHVMISTILYMLEHLCKNLDTGNFQAVLSLLVYQTIRDIMFSGLMKVGSYGLTGAEEMIMKKAEKEIPNNYSTNLSTILTNVPDDVWTKIGKCMKRKGDITPRGGNKGIERRLRTALEAYNHIFGDGNTMKALTFAAEVFAEAGHWPGELVREYEGGKKIDRIKQHYYCKKKKVKTEEGEYKKVSWASGVNDHSDGAVEHCIWGTFQILGATARDLIKRHGEELEKFKIGFHMPKNGKVSWQFTYQTITNPIFSIYLGIFFLKENWDRVYNNFNDADIMPDDDKEKTRTLCAMTAGAYNTGPGKKAWNSVKYWKDHGLKVDEGEKLTAEKVSEIVHYTGSSGKRETGPYIGRIIRIYNCLVTNISKYLKKGDIYSFYDRYGLPRPIEEDQQKFDNEHKRVVLCCTGTMGGELTDIQNKFGSIDAHFLILNGKDNFGGYDIAEDGQIISLDHINKRINYASNPNNDDIVIMLVGSPDSANMDNFNLDFENTSEVFSKIFSEKQGEALAYLIHSIKDFYTNVQTDEGEQTSGESKGKETGAEEKKENKNIPEIPETPVGSPENPWDVYKENY